jgi:starvation-inducible DNA-binding protein
MYLKTQNFHWSVTGPMLNALHQPFEVQYTELASADLLTQRIQIHEKTAGMGTMIS